MQTAMTVLLGSLVRYFDETDLLKIAPDYEVFSFYPAFGCRKSELLDHEAIAIRVGPVDVLDDGLWLCWMLDI